MKKALFFSPYLNTPGGGEVYCLNFAACLQDLDYSIHLAWKDQPALTRTLKLLDISLKYQLDPIAFAHFTTRTNLLSRLAHQRSYDLIFFLSDGSLPFLFSRHNLLHFQVPFTHLKPNLISKLKLTTIDTIVCNSQFTKQIIDRQLAVDSSVIYPPINFRPPPSQGAKQNIILSVGRFTNALHNKRQDILVNTFRTMVDTGLLGWELVLIGSTLPGQPQTFITSLRKSSQGYPIKLITNAPASTISRYYGLAKIFWLATGYGTDEQTNPEAVEHFGIVTVEAMNAGAVPVVINKGGQKEIIRHGQNGFLFDGREDLISHTQKLIGHPPLLRALAQQAMGDSQLFDLDHFRRRISELIKPSS